MAIDTDNAAKTRDKILLQLKMRGEHSAAELAELLGVTGMAVRQHLSTLADQGLVDAVEERRPVGRPARVWRLTERASERFPSGYGQLAAEVLNSVRDALGEDALAHVLEDRVHRQIEAYRSRLPGPDQSLTARVMKLALLRREEGFLPEWTTEPDGSCMLIENHCPVRQAAQACSGLCQSELRLFRAVLGEDVAVERTEHLLENSRRCAYRIRPAIEV